MDPFSYQPFFHCSTPNLLSSSMAAARGPSSSSTSSSSCFHLQEVDPSSHHHHHSLASTEEGNNDVRRQRKKGGGGVKLSTDPQSVAARERRHRISDRFKILQSLVPGGSKMDTVSMLEEAIHYVKFLKAQIWLHQALMGSAGQPEETDSPPPPPPPVLTQTAQYQEAPPVGSFDSFQYGEGNCHASELMSSLLLTTTTQQQQLQEGFDYSFPSPPPPAGLPASYMNQPSCWSFQGDEDMLSQIQVPPVNYTYFP